MNLWFTEEFGIVGGLRAQVKITRTLHSEKTDFQQIDIYETADFGRMLVLDGIIMCTEFDEFSYHEMITHVPLMAHANPEKVLVIGGGDGGTIREAIKHPTVKEVHLCEIDRRVVDTCMEHIPSMAGKLNDPKVHLHYEDGARWVKDRPGTYDIIIVDSTDPIGPGKVLFEEPFYAACRGSLREGGILANQAENFLLHTSLVGELLSFGKKLFPIPEYYYTLVPTYPGGMIGFTFFSTKSRPLDNFEEKAKKPGYEFVNSLRYWSPEMHRAAFVLPASIQKKIKA